MWGNDIGFVEGEPWESRCTPVGVWMDGWMDGWA